jgi:site-specific DNA-methyltransferase (adenine-specific)
VSWAVRHGDCRQLLRQLEPESIDSCPTDPPYGLAFMGRDWDSPDNVAFRPETWRLVLRALKPGAHLLAFGGTRTFHRLTCAIEDAGFEVRDTLCWLYGQGMPKSHDVSKAIDKAAGAEREVVGTRIVNDIRGGNYGSSHGESYRTTEHAITAPATPEAQQWDGWGTALSPSWEPIVLARKPLSSTVAGNVLEHGTGGLNVDGCRLPTSDDTGRANSGSLGKSCFSHRDKCDTVAHPAGRWPPNVALDEEAAAAVDRQSGERPTGKGGGAFGLWGAPTMSASADRGYGDTGGASRFFYCSKASPAERNAGLGDEQNPHPTVKPVALMRWLCRLVTPPGGLVLDPFCGSGSTGVAAVLEGFRFLGLEQDAEAVRVARLRIHHRQPNAAQVADTAPPQARQRSLFEGAA